MKKIKKFKKTAKSSSYREKGDGYIMSRAEVVDCRRKE